MTNSEYTPDIRRETRPHTGDWGLYRRILACDDATSPLCNESKSLE